MLKKLELSYNDFKIIKSYCDDIGIDFLSTADEIDSLDFLLELGIPIIKIGSGDITNIPYLTYIGKQRLPIILSTGMSCLGDIEKAIDILNTENKHDITLLHCTTNYPCPMNEVNLRAMQTLKHAFKYDIGYSDHTAGIDIPIAAAAMGACVIEKHFTLDTNMEGPDHRASLNPTEFERMVHGIRNIEEALGDGIKRPNKSETVISEVVLKRIVASKNIKKGEILCKDNMSVKRCSYGINASLWNIVSGHIAPKDFDTDEPILL